jgi:NADH-quinone oxidoreductase subunit E
VSVRRLHPVQPESFSFTPENLAWAKKQMEKYPQGKQASAVIPLLWRAQEQNDGWVSEPAIRYVAELIGLSFIRAYEVATFYTMFQLSPVGRKAHVQVCGTTPCMIRGAGELIEVCKRRIAPEAHQLSADGDFSWEEVECLGACVNAPMVEIFSDTYEDLTAESFERILDEFAAGRKPQPGPQVDRQFSAPVGGPTTLTDPAIYEKHARKTDGGREATVPPAKAGRPETASEETAPALKGPKEKDREEKDREEKASAKKPASKKSAANKPVKPRGQDPRQGN